MSKRTALVLSIICFVLLMVLVVLEKKYPEAGSELLMGMIG